MRLFLLKLLTLSGFFFLFLLPAKAQNCIPTGINNSVISLACNQTCSDITFSIPHLKNSTSYNVNSIAYTPYPYVTTAPALVHPCTTGGSPQDDKFFDTTFLPFNFCFYGASYSKMAISSNALLTFDHEANALRGSNWSLNGTATLPFTGGGSLGSGTCPLPGGVLFPRASIMAGYCDIIIDEFSTNKKMEARVEGVAPCRKFVISFNEIPMFDCETSLFSSQIVLHESTGLIDIFIGDKPSCPWNGGLAILGMQNWERDQAITAPGKNCTQWSESNTGYRFTPAGGGSRFVSSQMFTMAGVLVATADTLTTTPGLLDLRFPNVCSAAPNAQYRIVTTYTSCNSAAETLTTEDTITVNRTTSLNATATSTNTVCGSPTGTITVTVPNGVGTTPYSYVVDGGAPTISTANTFTFTNLGQGTHTVLVTDASNGCRSRLFVDVAQDNNLAATATPSATSCPGVNNGSILVTPSTGSAPYTFTLNPGAVVITGPTATFTGLAPGTYTISFTDASSCVLTTPLSVTVGSGTGLLANTTPTSTSCFGASDGSITVTPTNGTAPYIFTLDGGPITQTGNTATFNGLAAGNHTVNIVDANGCTVSPILNVNILAGSPLATNQATTATSCTGANNGSVTLTPTNGTGPYTFVLDGTTTQTGATSTTFINLSSGNHSVVISDVSGCSTAPINIVIAPGAPLATNQATTATSCAGANNGTATLTPTNGTGPYTFVLDGTTTQTGATSTTFINLPAGNHSVVISDASGCTTAPVNIVIVPGAALTTSANNTDVLCFGGATGSITVTAPAGPGPFEYSLDGTNWQASNVFNGLTAATYTVYFRETSSGCQGQLTRTVAQPAALAATSAGIPVVCNSQSNGTITVTPTGGTTPYQYSIDGGTNWQASNIFNVPIGTYTVTIRDANQCATTQMLTITEPVALSATAVQSNATCNGGNDGRITVTANGGNSNYQYSINGTSFQPANIFNVAPGTYTVTVRDNLGCTFAIPNVVVDLTNDLTFTAPTNPTICEGTSTQLQINSNALQYSWAPATGLSNPAVANPTANPTATTNYIITVTYGRCTDDIPLTVNVNTAPVPDAGANGFICYGQGFQLQGSGGMDYRWTPATFLSNAVIADPVAAPDRTITYSLSVTDANGCQSIITDQVTVDVTPPIKVTTFPADTVSYDGDQFQLLATSVATDYIWSPSTGLSNPAIANPVVTTGAVGDLVVYKVTASTLAGCRGEGFVRIRVFKGPELYVPTGFTPNGDGKNDKFFPFPVGIKEIKFFRVFNRWGQMVFSTSRVNDGWDGKTGGTEQASGVYVWMVEGVTEDGRVITKRGTVALIR